MRLPGCPQRERLEQAMAKILLADDEPSIQTLVRHIIEDGGYEHLAVTDGASVFDVVREQQPDLIILDVMMPRLDGFKVCEGLRAQDVLVPIIMLSAKGDIVDKSVGFSVGADDYLVKPFSPEELLMRIQAHLRQHDRIAAGQQQLIRCGDIEINCARHRVALRGADLSLTPKEYHILEYLAQNRDQIVTREQLIKQVWGEEFIEETSSVAVFIRKLREKIEDDPSHPSRIKTVRNAGYIFS
jgi:two-component system response regulator VicR